MNITNHMHSERSLAVVAEEVAKMLSFAQEHGGHQQIVTPLLYPGGACVVLRLEKSPNGYFVSDYGAARRECELMGGDRIFSRVAREQARKHGVNFDSDLIFDIEVPREALVTAAIAVANASKASVDETAEALSAKKADTQRERLWKTLFEVFPKESIEENAQFAGRSETWKFDAVVQMEKPILFQTVTPNSLSVHSAVARFLDVKDNGSEATVRVSVPLNVQATPHIQLLSRTSRIIGIAEPKTRFAEIQLAA